ncbi:MAG: helix-turn-helix transcriptional regulator, partial [Bacteroidales bacterium]|nr:helix-turn-helix transcriptional regulator [Bacteroidales bacterium]
MMENSEIRDALFPDCPIRNIIAKIGDKWSLLAMHTLLQNSDPMRFSAIRNSLPDISQKVLTSTLKNLEQDGFVIRKVFPEVPPRVEYSITARGRSFMTACRPM